MQSLMWESLQGKGRGQGKGPWRGRSGAGIVQGSGETGAEPGPGSGPGPLCPSLPLCTGSLPRASAPSLALALALAPHCPRGPGARGWRGPASAVPPGQRRWSPQNLHACSASPAQLGQVGVQDKATAHPGGVGEGWCLMLHVSQEAQGRMPLDLHGVRHRAAPGCFRQGWPCCTLGGRPVALALLTAQPAQWWYAHDVVPHCCRSSSSKVRRQGPEASP